MRNPYQDLPPEAFWTTGVGSAEPPARGTWKPKQRYGHNTAIVTFGSCFAQHIGAALRARGYYWLATEPVPRPLSAEAARRLNYEVFSARTGNIYTTGLLRQWAMWAAGASAPPDEVWQDGNRFFDPFRPAIEPGGFTSAEEMKISRAGAITAFRRAIEEAGVFVFTLGLTESWVNRPHGFEYAICPGTAAGQFDGDAHQFVNREYPDVRKALVDAIKQMRVINPRLRFLLTVSPVPLVATASGNHVLVATTESKSVLRAVAGSVCKQFGFVDYFPSYELITAHPFRGAFFESNQRTVSKAGIDHVMAAFFDAVTGGKRMPANQVDRSLAAKSNAEAWEADEVFCEEEIIERFRATTEGAND